MEIASSDYVLLAMTDKGRSFRRTRSQPCSNPSLDLDIHRRPYFSVHKFLIHWHTRKRPTIEPFGSLRSQVDATVTARTSIVIVPIGTVKRDAIFLDIQHPGYTGQVKTAGGNIAPGHVSGGAFMKCLEFSIRRGIGPAAQPSARGSACGKDQVILFVCHHHLFVE